MICYEKKQKTKFEKIKIEQGLKITADSRKLEQEYSSMKEKKANNFFFLCVEKEEFCSFEGNVVKSELTMCTGADEKIKKKKKIT